MKSLNKSAQITDKSWRELLAENKSLKERVEIAKEALKFYADEGNWCWCVEEDQDDYIMMNDDVDYSRVGPRRYAGKVAREALSQIEQE